MKTFPLRSLSIALALATAAALPSAASAEVSADLTLSSMYLWRGMDISDGKPAVSSTIQYDHESGFYVGTWFSSEGTPGAADTISDSAGDTIDVDSSSNGGSYEIDAYLGFAKSFGDVGVDLGYAVYMYPEAPGAISDSDIAEYIIGLSYGDFSVTGYINAEPDDFDDYKYISLDYSYGKFGFHYGMTDVGTDGGDYNDVNVSYAVTEEMTWTVSQASGDAIVSDSNQDDPIVMVSYSVPLK